MTMDKIGLDESLRSSILRNETSKATVGDFRTVLQRSVINGYAMTQSNNEISH